MKVAPPDCTSKVNTSPIKKNIREFIERYSVKSIISVTKTNPLFIKAKERNINANPINALATQRILSLREKKVIPMAHRKKRG